MKNFTIKMKQLFDKKLHMQILLIKKQICRMLFRMIFVVLPLAAAMTAFMQLFTLVRGADFERYAQRRLGDARFYVTSERHHRLYEDYDISLKLKALEQRLDGLVTFSQIGCAEYWIDFHDEKKAQMCPIEKVQKYVLEHEEEFLKNSWKTEQMIFVILGMDSEAAGACSVLEGEFDKEKYDRGNYVLIPQADGITQNIYDVGESVEICQKEYEIMAIVEIPFYLSRMHWCGEEVSFVMPHRNASEVFEEYTAYGEVFEAVEGRTDEAEKLLLDYVKNDKELIFFSRKELFKEIGRFSNAAFLLMAVLCIFIGILVTLDCIHTIISVKMQEITDRKEVFRKEKIRSILIAFLITVIAGSFLSWTKIRGFCEESEFIVYYYSIFPVVLLTAILIGIVNVIFMKRTAHNRKEKNVKYHS